MRGDPAGSIAGPVVLVIVCAGCAVGAKLEKFSLAHGPEGATAEISTGTQVVQGELLEVRPDGMLLLTPLRPAGHSERRLVVVGYDVPREARFPGVRETLPRGSAPGAAQRERLRLVSRFPQGVSADLLKRLLQDCGQDEPATLRP
jgi:hypothetical protein